MTTLEQIFKDTEERNKASQIAQAQKENESKKENKSKLFTQIRINLTNHDTIKAVASCKLANSFFLRGIRVIHGKNRLFVGMPAEKDKQGEYRDIYFPASKEVRDELAEAVLAEYDKALAKRG